MFQATRTIEVNVSREKFFEVITDFESYPQFLDKVGLVGISVDEDNGDEKVVTQSVKKMGKVVSYTLRYKLDKPNKTNWSLVKGQMMSKNEGSWTIEEAGEGRCKATYSIEVHFGFLVPKTLIKILVSSELPTMLELFKNRAENG